MHTIALSIATTLAVVALAAPLHAQHTGHGAHHAPAAKSDTIAKSGKDTHAGHGARGTAAGSMREHMSGWKELDAYHIVMMRVWHPAKEKGDLAPIRAEAAALAASADALVKAAVPAACDTPANREHVAALQRDSHALARLVPSEANAAVLEALRDLHERFEAVNRGCKAR